MSNPEVNRVKAAIMASWETVERTMEYEADMYGLNAARQPDGEATWT
jgi:hypothetical protein